MPDENEIEEYYKKLQNQNFGKQKTSYSKLIERELKFPNASIDAKRIILQTKLLTQKKSLLDIGAGHGFISKEAKINNFIVTALEINEDRSSIFNKMNGSEPIKKMFDDNFAKNNLNSFDVIIVSQLLEHIADTQNFLKNLMAVLKKDGICFIAVPNSRSLISLLLGKKDFFLIPPEHLNFFSIKGLNILFEKNNFKMIHKETISRITFDRFNKISNLYLVKCMLFYFFKISFLIFDYFNKGMIINCYFKKNI
tara:strand:+ start:7016 stop:7774 length:759 start_codon:yes stop_codon:yes gene_type:complete